MKAALLLLACAFAAHAEVIAEAPLDGGAAVLFHDTAGPRMGEAKLVEHIAADGTRTPGCYVLRGDKLACVFLDGDIGAVPVAALKPPKKV
jgi:hypothetical protein